MRRPSILIFADFPSSNPSETAAFYSAVFGWDDIEPRPKNVFHRIVPGGFFRNRESGEVSTIPHLHMGISNVKNVRPHPDPHGTEPRYLSHHGRTVRIWILVEDDSQDRILDTAEDLGATVHWRHHFYAEFDGISSSFTDPWGHTFVLWTKPQEDPDDLAGVTREQ